MGWSTWLDIGVVGAENIFIDMTLISKFAKEIANVKYHI